MLFAMREFPVDMPLYLLKLVTDGRFLEIVTLSSFRKARITETDDIIFFEICNR